MRIWLNGDIVGSHPGWNDTSPGPTITVVSGETITLLLNATDSLTHNWFIDTKNNGQPDPNGISSPDFYASNSPLSFTFTPVIGQNIPAPGNWTYRCRYHPFPYMYGTIRVVQPDFSLSASPPMLKLDVGAAGTSTITASPLFRFNETISLSVASSTGLTATISPGSMTAASGTATLTTLSSRAGNYTATVIGTSGPLTHSLDVTVEISDFAIAANPAASSTEVNSPANSTITMTTMNHFAGVVDLTSNSTSCSLNPTKLTGPETSTLSCTFATPGLNHVLVTAVNGLLSHSVAVTFNVTALELADLVITAANTTVSLLRGSHTNDVIALKSIGFSGTISLSVTISPTNPRRGPGARLENSIIILSANGTNSTVLRLSAHGATSPGDYIVTVTARGGSLTRSVTITIVVTSRR